MFLSISFQRRQIQLKNIMCQTENCKYKGHSKCNSHLCFHCCRDDACVIHKYYKSRLAKRESQRTILLLDPVSDPPVLPLDTQLTNMEQIIHPSPLLLDNPVHVDVTVTIPVLEESSPLNNTTQLDTGVKAAETISTECTICMVGIRNYVLNCGHMICLDCSSKIRKTCPWCQKTIFARIKIYFN